MSYEEFGRMRFLDFFPRTELYGEDHEGGLEAGIGLACYEGYGFMAAFISPADCDWQTSEIQLSYENGECPVAEGNAFLAELGLGLRKGMTQADVKELLGSPVRTFHRRWGWISSLEESGLIMSGVRSSKSKDCMRCGSVGRIWQTHRNQIDSHPRQPQIQRE